MSEHPIRLCHWDRVPGPHRNGEPTTAVVWICEHPYRTMCLTPPDNCDGCPLEQVRREAEARRHLTQGEPPTFVM